MSSVLEEMRAVLEGNEEYLAHYGTKRHSGRYPYGSGEDPYQHGGDFLTRVEKLRKEGWKEKMGEAEQGKEKQHPAYAWHFTYGILFKFHSHPMLSPSPYFINEATEAEMLIILLKVSL